MSEPDRLTPQPLEEARAILPERLLRARVLGFAAHEQEAIVLFGVGDYPPKLPTGLFGGVTRARAPSNGGLSRG